MPTVEDLGIKVKNKYPAYRHLPDAEVGRLVKKKHPEAYSAFVEMEAVRMVDSVNLDINEQSPIFNSSTVKNVVAVVLILISIYLFYNVDTFSNGYKIFAALVLSITFFILSIVLFKNAYKSKNAEYEFAKQKINDRHEILEKNEKLRKTIADREVADAKRQLEIAQYQNQIALLLMNLRNELAVSNAAELVNLDRTTYLQIRKMQAEAQIEATSKAIDYQLDNARIRELREIENEAQKAQKQLTLNMFDIRNLLPFHEAQVLNSQLAELSLELQEAEKLPDSSYKLRETKRITNQMKAWGQNINGRYKQLK